MQREFVREVFQEIEVRGKEIVTITPRAAYAPLSALDRRERFGQPGPECCSMAPPPGFEPGPWDPKSRVLPLHHSALRAFVFSCLLVPKAGLEPARRLPPSRQL